MLLFSITQYFEESAKLCVSRTQVPTSLASLVCLCANMPTCLASLHAHVVMCLACLPTHMETCLACLCAHMPMWLALSQALNNYVLMCITSNITSNNKNEFSMAYFTYIFGTFSLPFTREIKQYMKTG